MRTNNGSGHESKSELTTEIGDFERETEGYIVISPLPDSAKEAVHHIQDIISNHLPPDSLWTPKEDQLHITFAHVVSPDADYSDARSSLFEETRMGAESALRSISRDLKNTSVKFNQVETFPGAIILTAQDDGSLGYARANFLQQVTLPEGTRNPPSIIHITIARFKERLDMQSVLKATSGLDVNITFNLEKLQLIKEDKMYTQSHDVIKEFESE